MDPNREPRSGSPAATLSDDALVAQLRAHAPGLPAVQFDGRAVTARARAALRRRQRRLRTCVAMGAGAAAAYLAVMVLGPVPMPGGGAVDVPGGQALRAFVSEVIPRPPEPDRWPGDAARLQAEVIPLALDLDLRYYLDEEQCPFLEYARGSFTEPGPECQDPVPFDAQARADFDAITAAIERSGVAVERIYRQGGGIYVWLPNNSWQYNWAYAYLPDGQAPPAPVWPEERWTHISGDWWFYRAHDD